MVVDVDEIETPLAEYWQHMMLVRRLSSEANQAEVIDDDDDANCNEDDVDDDADNDSDEDDEIDDDDDGNDEDDEIDDDDDDSGAADDEVDDADDDDNLDDDGDEQCCNPDCDMPTRPDKSQCADCGRLTCCERAACDFFCCTYDIDMEHVSHRVVV